MGIVSAKAQSLGRKWTRNSPGIRTALLGSTGSAPVDRLAHRRAAARAPATSNRLLMFCSFDVFRIYSFSYDSAREKL